MITNSIKSAKLCVSKLSKQFIQGKLTKTYNTYHEPDHGLIELLYKDIKPEKIPISLNILIEGKFNKNKDLYDTINN